MANYCNAEDVQVKLGFTNEFSVTTKPTLTQVETLIDSTTKEIDSYLYASGVTTQPTDTNVLGKLKEVCSYGAAARVGMGYHSNNESISGTQAREYWDFYKEYLNEIKEMPELYGAGGSTSFISNQVTDGTYSESDFEAQFFDPVEGFK